MCCRYSVLRTVPSSEEQVRALRALDGQPGLEWWTPPRRGADSDVMVAPGARAALEQALTALGLSWEVLHENLQE